MAEKDPLFGRFDIFQTRPNIISIALALCYFGATILKSFPEAGLDHFTFLYHNYYSSPFRNKNTAAKSLRCKAFTMLIYIKIDRPLPWWSVNLSWHAGRDSNYPIWKPLHVLYHIIPKSECFYIDFWTFFARLSRFVPRFTSCSHRVRGILRGSKG